jgi:hypothetical protein
MPKLDDLIHLPSWQSVAKFVVDPGDVFGKTDRLAQTINKAPDHLGSVPIVKPHLPSTDQSPGDNLKHLATGGIL